MKKNILILFFLMLCFSCKDRYFPELESTGKGYMVVEGVLKGGNEPTTITISRTYGVDEVRKPEYVTGAVVSVESNDNTTKQLQMMVPGIYQNPNLELVASKEYRLRIKTTDGKEYLSDYVKVKATPEIDEVGWKQTPDGVQLFVNTHDPSNSTNYYRWDWDETWEIRSYYFSQLIWDPSSPESEDGLRGRRFPQEDISTCWKYGKSTNILISSSTKLTSDVIHEFPIKYIPNGDERLSVKYSVLLRQYAMDKNAYEFYDLMKKNTESIGTVFDPMPSEIRGNIKSLNDPKEIVIGYISASTSTQKRVFINSPIGWRFSQSCELTFVRRDSTKDFFGSGAYIPLYETFRPIPPAEGYDGTTPACADCTKRGGNLQKPSYWP